MVCKKCGAELEEGSIFCPECGQNQIADEAPAENSETVAEDNAQQNTSSEETGGQEGAQMRYCQNCGTPNEMASAFCCSCGLPLEAGDGTTADQAAAKQQKKPASKLLVAGIAAAAVLVLLLAATAGILMTGKKKAPLIYVKDNAMTSLKGKTPYEIADDIFADDNGHGLSGRTVQLTKDQKYIFYPEDYIYDYFSSYSGSYNLYVKPLGNEKAEGEKIDTGVTDYRVIDRNHVVYLKGNDHKLYYYSKGEKEKLASGVENYYLSENKKYVLWKTDDRDVYIQNISKKEDKVKLAKDVYSIAGLSEDFQKIIYRKDDNLYVINKLGEAEKIASGISNVNVYNIDSDAEIYYTVEETVDTSDIWNSEEAPDVSEWVVDDYAEDDADMKRPSIGEYKTTDEYNEACKQYDEKNKRDYIRRRIYSRLVSDGVKLYYYSEKSGESELIFEGKIKNRHTTGSVYVINCINKESIEKESMDTLMKADDSLFNEKLDKLASSGVELKMFYQGKGNTLDFDLDSNISLCDIASHKDSGKTYISIFDSEEEEYSLWKLDHTKGQAKPERIADNEETYIDIVRVTKDGVWNCRYDEGDADSADLYMNDKEIDSDVLSSGVSVKNDVVYYYTDYSSKDGSGTLRFYNGKKPQTVSDDVYTYMVNDEGKIAMLVDYSLTRFYGDLKMYFKGKIEKIDTDVTCIVSF